ncbi:MAG: hypothetical protein ACKV22_41500 [Bryobacteraceae bacterium]
MKRFAIATILSAVLTMTALADRPAQRQRNQQKRIAGGVESGELTAKETARLENKERKMHKEIRKDRRDGGGLTAKERLKIENKQDRLSRQIYREKHDRQTQK